MANSTLCAIIGWGSAVLTFIGTIYSCVLLAIDIDRYQHERENPDGTLYFVSDFDLTEVIIAVVAFAAMFIASVLLIIGLRKKRHQYIAIWIGVTAVCIVLNLLRLIRSQRSMAQNLLTVGIQVCLWYPIVSYYRDMRKDLVPTTAEEDPLDFTSTSKIQQNNVDKQNPAVQPLYPKIPGAEQNAAVPLERTKLTGEEKPTNTTYPTLPKE
ncbi:uncharacterized protein LOC101892376 [Musca domestica]|uniref:Uncharacterized protein LOC101892376 n=1 Tax=Musca domestica TaxID=7370 RepID=A0A9J7CLQ9_MUSDO|nr:uncharacterized protein LOC101892376 [Musca domestica]